MACHRLWESLPKQPQSCGLKIRIGYEASTCMRAFTHNQPHQLTAVHWKLAGTLPYAVSPLRSCASSEHIHPTLAEERKGTVHYAGALVVNVTSYTHMQDHSEGLPKSEGGIGSGMMQWHNLWGVTHYLVIPQHESAVTHTVHPPE